MAKCNKRDKHHIFPRSRGGEDKGRNIVLIKKTLHANYHRLFFNLTPVEIIVWLVEYFWAGQWEHVEEALRRKRR